MKTLSEYSKDFFKLKTSKNPNDMELFEKSLIKFCKTGKKEDAFSVFFCYCEIFKMFGRGYQTIDKLLELLSDHEFHAGELLLKHRDHYSHSVYVFALGLAIYVNGGIFKNAFKKYYGLDDNSLDEKFLYLWGMTALFHDIGYPFQLTYEQNNDYLSSMTWRDEEEKPIVSFANMDALLKVSPNIDENYKDIDNIEKLLSIAISSIFGYPEEKIFTVIKDRFKNQKKHIDHGYFSALLLNREFTKNPEIKISKEIIDVLVAISMHNNINKFDFKKLLGRELPISLNVHPLTYLLIVCDELQNWNREAFGDKSKKSPLAYDFLIKVTAKNISVKYIFNDYIIHGYKDGQPTKELNINVQEILNGDFVNKINKFVKDGFTFKAKSSQQKKKIIAENYASENSFINLCDFAYAIHESYRTAFGSKTNPIKPFDELSLKFKLSNIEQAKSYAKKLELINCFYSSKELDYPMINKFVRTSKNSKNKRDDLGFLAREEHVRWVKERLEHGWKYGVKYKTTEERNAKKIHKDIIPYDALPLRERKKDELMVKNMIPFLYEKSHSVRIYSYRDGRKPVLDIVGCGHRTIDLNNKEVRNQVKEILKHYQKDYRVVVRTNFAFGADLLIADCANELGITIKATLPFNYKKHIQSIKDDAKKYGYKFSYDDELKMRHLLAQTVSCKVVKDDKYTYLNASKYIISKCKKLIAIWDAVETILQDDLGNPTNQGGTYHNICIAKNSRGLKDEDIHIIHCER